MPRAWSPASSAVSSSKISQACWEEWFSSLVANPNAVANSRAMGSSMLGSDPSPLRKCFTCVLLSLAQPIMWLLGCCWCSCLMWNAA